MPACHAQGCNGLASRGQTCVNQLDWFIPPFPTHSCQHPAQPTMSHEKHVLVQERLPWNLISDTPWLQGSFGSIGAAPEPHRQQPAAATTSERRIHVWHLYNGLGRAQMCEKVRLATVRFEHRVFRARLGSKELPNMYAPNEFTLRHGSVLGAWVCHVVSQDITNYPSTDMGGRGPCPLHIHTLLTARTSGS